MRRRAVRGARGFRYIDALELYTRARTADILADNPLEARRIECAPLLAQAGATLSARGWTPSTSSNFSMRVDDKHAAVTVSGRDKGRLTPEDVMLVDLEGNAVGSELRPSAETLLHTQIYALKPEIGAVLHTHSRTQTVASMMYAHAGSVRLEGYELLKAFHGFDTHETALTVPVFPNAQDMKVLTRDVGEWLAQDGPAFGYLIAGHGLYAWGRDLGEAMRHLETFDFLLDCELELRRLKA